MKSEELLKDREEVIKREIPSEDSTSREEKLILMEEILKHKPMVILETGTHRGLTTCYMGVAAKEVGSHIHTYDPFEWGAYRNFAKFLDLPITYYQKAGKDCELTSVDFAFIDGFHEKHHVISEMNMLLPKLSSGAIVYFHDTNGSNESCDVPGAINELGLKVEYLKTLNGMAKYVHNVFSNNPDGEVKVPPNKLRKPKKANA